MKSLQAIYIPQLAKAPDRTDVIGVKEYLPDLETLMPVQGSLKVIHRGNYLEVMGQAETIVTLACDRCLQQYNYRLKIDTSEMIWLKANSETEFQPLELELEYDELVETLPPDGYFDPAAWLYEQLCLELPQQQLCRTGCLGLTVEMNASNPSVDQRWAMLEQLRDRLPQSSVSDE